MQTARHLGKKQETAARRGTSVRIERSFYESAVKTAKAECRTISGQVEYWARIGKASLDNPDLPVEFIQQILVARERMETEPFVPEDSLPTTLP